ncbi:MAG: proline--tRNA ligase [Nitrospirota bacterium]|nr:proline--tRNA ligase [Nitrospirota bacterium]
MRYSQLLIPTLKETPADAEVISHKLMLRAGMIRKVAAGIYTYLPMGLRVIRKVENIIREEMNRAGAQEVLMPAVQPAELWQESKRWDFYGKELMRIKDRHDREFCIGPTHEEVITDLVKREVKSYRQLPLNLYQIQTKFRDEIRPRFGLMRGREFIMKDAYSFHKDEASVDEGYRAMYEAYKRIFSRCGLDFRAVEADTGTIGGSFSHEFMVLAETGEDFIASCDTCDYAANMEKAESRSKRVLPGEKEPEKPMEKVSTPGKKAVDEVAAFLKTTPEKLVKTLIYKTDDGRFVAVLLRGDHEVNDVKLKHLVDAKEVELAAHADVERLTNAPSGFAGPVGLAGIPIYADQTVDEMANFIVGANEGDAHYVNVNYPRDFKVERFADLRKVVVGDSCPRCHGSLRIFKGIEVGHVFKLGTKYSEAMKAVFLDEEGKEKPFIMGCYGIGVGRTAAAAIEQNHDEFGIKWPLPIAPFTVAVIPLNVNDAASMETGEAIYRELLSQGIDTMIDDRDERAGVKLKDADLVGIPLRVVIGERGLKEGVVEIKDRRTGVVDKVPVAEAVTKVCDALKNA